MRLKQTFPDGTQIIFSGLQESVLVKSFLGSGSQGEVYRIILRDEDFALKWYHPDSIKRDRDLFKRLQRAISAGSPSQDFIWPSFLLRNARVKGQSSYNLDGYFGYLMRLRPEGYVSATEHYGGYIDITIQRVIIACKKLCEAFHALHALGFCYKDLSLGNIFLAPDSGNILVCDNDNADVNGRISGMVLGTPGFIAPEILVDNVHPNVQSDLFSLANIIFRMLTRHDPFCGLREVAESLLDEATRLRLYAKQPLFIFNPIDDKNRPDPKLHSGVLLTWEIYPHSIKELFIKSFVNGLKDPSARVLTNEWIEHLEQLLDHRLTCAECDSECFPPSGSSKVRCWNCGADVFPEHVLHIGEREIYVTEYTEIHASHFRIHPSSFQGSLIGLVTKKEDRSNVLGLKNCSQDAWTGVLRTEKSVLIQPGRTCQVDALTMIRTQLGIIRIQDVRQVTGMNL